MMLRLTCSTLAVIAMTAPAAFSLTADQVWETWATYLTDSGYDIAIGSREGGGNDLVLKDVVLTATPDDNATTTVTVPVIRMGQTGGADIRTEYPDGASFHFAGETQQAGETVALKLEGSIGLTGLETISREEGGHQVDTSTGPEVVVAVTSLTVGEDSLGEAPLTLTMQQLTSTSTFLGGLNTLSDARIGSLAVVIDMADVEGNAEIKGQVDISEITLATETNFPAGHDGSTAAALNEALRAGAILAGKGGFASLAMSLNMNGADTEAPKDMQAAMQGGAGSISFGLDGGRLGYQFDITDISYDLQGSEMPFPVQVALGAASTDLQLPLLASEEPQSFKLAYSLGDLVLNEAIWAMIDQKGALVHDPANLDIDLTGELLVHQDLMIYAEQAEAQDIGMAEVAPPLSPVALTLNQLALSVLGASASASGAVSFPDPDNLDVAVGTLNAQFNGLNGLLDNLVQAGFVEADQVQGMRMMLMMIAKPVDGQADALQTTLEMKEDGSVFANGMQLK